MIRIACLGTVRATDADRPLDLGGRRQRAVLAVLAAARGHTVSADALVAEVWGGDPPPSATAALQAYVSRLRGVLEPDRRPREPARVLRSVPPGYDLHLPVEAVDTWHVTDLVRRAANMPDAEAVRLVDDALALWRGDPFAEYADEEWSRHEVLRLDEVRTSAVEIRAAACLRLGRATDALRGIEPHVREHPWREEAVALHARSLYAAGRQVEALEALRRLRRHLDDELGVRPGPDLDALETDILRHAERLRPPTATATPVPLAEPPLAVPAARSALVGRDAERTALARAADATLVADRPRLVWLVGDAGIGKSALVEDLLRRLGEGADGQDAWMVHRLRCPEVTGAPAGVAWQDLVGHPDPVAYALGDSVLRSLGDGPSVVALEDVHRADELSLHALRHVLQAGDAPVLVVATYRPHEAGPLLASTAAAATDVTLERIHLRGLADRDARALLATQVTTPLADRVWRRLVDRAAGNPLFLAQLGRLVSSEGPAACDALPVGVRDLLRRRVERLAPETVEVLAHAAVLGRDVDVDVLVALEEDWTGLDEVGVLDHLDAGLVAGLLDSSGPGELRFSHVLVRDTLEDELPPLRRQRIHRAALDVLRRLRPDAVEEQARHATAGLDRRSATEAVPVLVAAAGRADDASAVDLLRTALQALDLVAVEPSRRIPVRRDLVRALARSGDTVAARAERAVAVTEAGDHGTVADVAAAWAWPAPFLWSRRSAETSSENAVLEIEAVLADLRASGTDRDRPDLVVELLAAQAIEADPGNVPQVVASSSAALTVAEATGDPELLCRALNACYLGTFAHDTQYLPRLAHRLVHTARGAGLLGYEATGHVMLHSAALGDGDLDAARSHAQEGLALSTRGQLSELLLVADVLGATTALLEGRPDRARSVFEEVCSRITASGDPNGAVIELWARFSVEFVVGDTSVLLPELRRWSRRMPGVLNDVLVCALLDAGELDAARATWRPVDWQRDATWLLRTAVRAWIAARLGETEVGARIWEDLAPWSGRVVRTLNGALVLGPVDHFLGLLAPLVSRPAPHPSTPVTSLVPNRHA